MLPTEWLSLDSSNISKVKFEPNRYDLRGDLLIEFNTGKVYKYRDVPAHKVENMVHDSSPNTSFQNNIKPYHSGEKYP